MDDGRVTGEMIVLVSRLWQSPQIEIEITPRDTPEGGIEIALGLDDFVTALLHEIGSPTLVFRQATFEQLVRDAAEKVVRQMKAETARVV